MSSGGSHRRENPERTPSYGGVMPAEFGGTASLFRFTLPIPAPLSAIVRIGGTSIYDQKGYPTCTAAATATLLELAGAAVDVDIEPISVAYLYLAGKELVSSGNKEVNIENQLDGGLPLAACIQGLCTFGAVARRNVPHPDDPIKLSEWLKAEKMSIKIFSSKMAELPGDLRPLRIYPSIDSLRATILGGKAMAFSFRISPVSDLWMREHYISHGSPTFPPLDDVGPRLATHAAVIIGYNDEKEAFLIQNSFGSGWGDEGRFWLGYGTILRQNFSGSEFYALG